MKILFSIVSVVEIREHEISILVQSAKKYFLTNHDINFVVFTDVDTPPYIKDVKYININNDHCDSRTYYQFQKILSLNYINLNTYDYFFVCDNDSVFVNDVIDSDFDNFTPDLCVLNHFGEQSPINSLNLVPIKIKKFIHHWSDIITIENDELEHTMGNFWGGNQTTIKKLLEFTNNFWDKHKNHDFNGLGFFSNHSEELILIKFIDLYKIKEKRITTSLNFENPAFLTDFKGYGDLVKNLHRFKMIHDTKYLIKLCHKIF